MRPAYAHPDVVRSPRKLQVPPSSATSPENDGFGEKLPANPVPKSKPKKKDKKTKTEPKEKKDTEKKETKVEKSTWTEDDWQSYFVRNLSLHL